MKVKMFEGEVLKFIKMREELSVVVSEMEKMI